VRNLYRILVGKPAGKRPLRRPSHRWEDDDDDDDDDDMDLREIGWRVVNWIHVAQDRDQLRDLVNTIMNLQVP
jgi:hypothetical protein